MLQTRGEPLEIAHDSVPQSLVSAPLEREDPIVSMIELAPRKLAMHEELVVRKVEAEVKAKVLDEVRIERLTSDYIASPLTTSARRKYRSWIIAGSLVAAAALAVYFLLHAR